MYIALRRPFARLVLVFLVLVFLVAGCSAEPTRPAGSGASSAASGGVGGGAVTFPAADGTSLAGTVFGAGKTAVILSNMGDNDPAAWLAFAPILAARGYLVLSYSFRYKATEPFTTASAQGTVSDLRGAMAFVKQRGARRVVAIGASLGGMATAKVAGDTGIAAIAVISSPDDLAGYGLTVFAADIAGPVPKLFVAATGDTVVPIAATQRLFDLAAEPKQWQTYPSTEHGVHMFGTASAEALQARLIEFVTASAPA